MKLLITEEWVKRMAALEGDLDISAGQCGNQFQIGKAMTHDDALTKKADEFEAQAAAIRQEVDAARKSALKAEPLNDRMIYAAYDRCACGAGMAYDPAAEGDKSSPLVLERSGPSKWECSDIVRYETFDAAKQAEVKDATHTPAMPFAFWEVKSENQPSANGATTRND